MATAALRFSCVQPKVSQEPSLRPTSLHAFRFPALASRCRLPRLVLASVAHGEASAAVDAADAASFEEAVEAADVESFEEEEEIEAGAETQPVAAANTKLYVGNLPYNCDSAQLAAIVQQYGEPEMIEVLYDRVTGKSRGFAFVTMSSVADCEAVINNVNGTEHGGRVLRVNFSDKPIKKEQPLYPETEFKLFVGNLSWAATSENLQEAFQQCGNVVGARVLYDGESGQSRGYGFVSYSTKEEMDAALESLNGADLLGRPMRINVALGRR